MSDSLVVEMAFCRVMALFTTNRSRVDQSSRMLQAVLIMFLTVKTPESLLNIFSALFIIDYYLFIAPKVTEILTALSIINASASFVIYCIMSSHFREVFNETMIVTIVPTG
uniref:G protein-coupled receptor n=1 Tax=Caenorhabditis tropicalis TaxID=1561998 RepID=A0A1I7TFM1_9PELO